MKRAQVLTTIQIAWLAVLLARGGEPTTPAGAAATIAVLSNLTIDMCMLVAERIQRLLPPTKAPAA